MLGLVFEGGIIAKLIVALFVFLQFAFLIVVIYPYIYAIGYIKDGTAYYIICKFTNHLKYFLM